MNRASFTGRGRRLRGVIDLLTGRYPRFILGGGTGGILPIFHFHEVRPEQLEPCLEHLAHGGYRTVTSEAVSALVHHGKHPGKSSVVLCFDDAWASLWTVAGPLLRRYGFSAIAFVVPARVPNASTPRPTLDDGVRNPADVDRSDVPFATWPELRALHVEGTIDLQSHTYSHAMMFVSDRVIDFVTPAFAVRSLLSRPLAYAGEASRFLMPSDLGAPLYEQHSRMSDRRRYLDDPVTRQRCQEHVADSGGAAFFSRRGWRAELRSLIRSSRGVYESEAQQKRAILEELDQSRSILASRLGLNSLRQVCYPWAVAGVLADEAAHKVKHETAFADRWFGMRAVRAGDNPFRLMRLKNSFIFSLPGPNRRIVPFGAR